MARTRCLSRFSVASARCVVTSFRTTPPFVARRDISILKAPRLSSCISNPRRFQSTDSSAAVEPPDYLTEGELAIFEKLKAELDPIKLEVSTFLPMNPFKKRLWTDSRPHNAGPGYQRWLWFNVCA